MKRKGSATEAGVKPEPGGGAGEPTDFALTTGLAGMALLGISDMRDETAVGLFLGLSLKTTLFQQWIEVDRSAIGLGLQDASRRHLTDGFEDPD